MAVLLERIFLLLSGSVVGDSVLAGDFNGRIKNSPATLCL